MRKIRELLVTIADNEAYQQALLQYNEALLHFHTLTADTEATQREGARLLFESAGNRLQAAVDTFLVDRLCDMMRRLRQ